MKPQARGDAEDREQHALVRAVPKDLVQHRGDDLEDHAASTAEAEVCERP